MRDAKAFFAGVHSSPRQSNPTAEIVADGFLPEERKQRQTCTQMERTKCFEKCRGVNLLIGIERHHNPDWEMR
jgi:hypothetical protein